MGPRRRRLAWIAFVLLAGYAPVVAAVRPGDDWLLSVTVAGLVGYVLVVDDVLRRRQSAAATATDGAPGSPDRNSADMATRGRPMDDPGSMSDN
jgi:hypothetical protein